MYVHIDIPSLHAFTWLSKTHVSMVPFLQLSNPRLPCLFLSFLQASCTFTWFFSFCLLILLSPFVLCLLWRELTFTCLQLPEADFLREISFKYYKYSSARSLQSLMWQTCLTTHRTSLNSSLARPIDLGKVLKKCSLWSSSNLTSVSATLLGSPSGKDRWITLQMCLALPKFNLNIWFLKSWSALPTM